MQPADGERAAVVGFAGQFGLAARIVRAKLTTLEWIRVADPAAGVADDFQFKSGFTRHALQVKWSQYPGSFAWGALINGTGDTPALIMKLAQAWQRLRSAWTGPLVLHLRSNDYASTATPPAGTPLAEAVAEGPRHFAAFLARAFEPVQKRIAQGMTRWNDLARQPEIEQWSVAWDALRTATGLGENEFVAFVRDLAIHFAPPTDDPLVRPDHDPEDTELATLAWTLQAIVGDPARTVQLGRDELLDRLGWSDRLKYRHPHRFPVPTVYAANEAARAELEARLTTLPGGYVALVGPAGSGKSTLLASLRLPGRVARYYAFVPDAPDPLSGRGEADSFLHDVSLTLEESGLHRQGYANDLRSQRSVLFDQLDQAGRRWNDRGEMTVIVVDGLDHIPREQNPARSLLEELPAPSALPDGVFVILGTQTLAILHRAVQAKLGEQDRTVTLPPLSPHEVGKLADAAGPGTWLLSGQRNALVRASEGHPLALTYLLQELTALEQREPDEDARRLRGDALLADASEYGRDVEQRYRGYFQAVGNDREVLDLLGAVARLRTPVNLDWLATWADPHAVTAFAKRTATFFHRNGTEWQFIHNSFRRFLADETARVAGHVDPARDKQLHLALAEVCAASEKHWPLYRDEEIAHRFLAGQYDRVMELTTPDRLRDALLAIHPPATVHDHAVLALRAAASIDNHSAYVRTLLFVAELWQRQYVLEPEKLTATILVLGPPATAIEHIVRGGRLRISRDAALEHAAEFAATGHIDAAQLVLRACGGLAGLIEGQRPSAGAIADWARVTWHLSGVDLVLSQLDHHLPHPATAGSLDDDAAAAAIPSATPDEVAQRRNKREREAATINCRNLAHARCFDLLIDARDDDALDELTAVIDTDATADWRARARYMRANAALEDRAPSEVLRWVRELVDIDAASRTGDNDDDEKRVAAAHAVPRPVPLALRIRAAELLVRSGFADAPEIDYLVPPGTIAAWPPISSASKGLDPFRTLLALWRLREVHPDSTPPPPASEQPQPPPARGVGNERFRRALRVLARLEGQQLAAEIGRGEPPVVAAHADPVIRLLEVPLQQTHEWTGWYIIRDAAPDMFRRLIRLAAEAGGSAGLSRLLDRFDDGWTTRERASFWSPERRQAVIMAALDADVETKSWAHGWLAHLDSEINAWPYDAHDRVSSWLAQARAWMRVGDRNRAMAAAQSAIGTALGVGVYDDDRQLVGWVDWLAAAASTGRVTTAEFLVTIRDYASRLTAAAPEAPNHAEAAAERLLELTFPVDSSLACALAESMCDAGVLAEASAIQAVVLTACCDSAVPVMLGAVTGANLLLPILRVPSKIVDAVGTRGNCDEALVLLQQAEQVWTVPDERADASNSEVATAVPPPSADDEVSPLPRTAGALLTALRNADTSAAGPAGGWDTAVERVVSGVVPSATARALLEHATRLRLGGVAIGGLAALAARSGEVDGAAAALIDALARTPGYGWFEQYDGGSRLRIFDAALRDRHPALLRLAAHDLAGSLANGPRSGQISATDLRRIAELVAGIDIVAAAWPDVVAYLDQFARTGAPMPASGHDPVPAASPAEALIRWVAGYLGHPVRPLDFGARRTLQVALQLEPAAAQRVLAETITAEGWAAEAALLTLVTVLTAERPTSMSAELTAAVKATAVGPDAICRDLARRLAQSYGVSVARPAQRPLPAGYRLALPPLPERTAPELDAHGTPHLDPHDPQHLVAPFDEPLQHLAGLFNLDPSTVLHRAATIATSSDEPWTRGGHRAQASRLKGRNQRHSYRPWAYMAGRRALGIVLAELLDAGILGTRPPFLTYAIGLIDEQLVHIEPQPVEPSTPNPWRSNNSSTFDIRGWCDETQEAAQIYAAASSVTTPYLLAERGEWCSLEWGKPEEIRRICAMHRASPRGDLLLPARRAWEATTAGAHRYPRRLRLDWSHEELVVYGRELSTDARWLEWLALHPAAGFRLGWEPAPDDLFTWRGTDGDWRARTVRRARGQLSHQPSAAAACAEVWQVVLSDTGRTELLAAFPATTRTLALTRTLPANARETRPEDETAVAQVLLSEPS